jgi:hypothetical protein
MLQKTLLTTFVLLITLILSACAAIPTTSTPVPVGTETSGKTDEQGLTTLTLGEGESRLELRLSIKDIDTNTPLPNISVKATALQTGVFVWSYDEASTHLPRPSFLSYDQFNEQGELDAQFAWVSLFITLFRVAVAAEAIVSLVEFYEELELEQFYESPDVKRTCLVVTGNTILNALELAPVFNDISQGVTSVSLFVRVIGTPARLRGVTEINFGFTRKNLDQEVDAFITDITRDVAEAVSAQTGILDEDVVNVCWFSTENENYPVIELSVEREDTPFTITQLDFPFIIQPQPLTDTEAAQSVKVSWQGPIKLPLVLEARPIFCPEGFACDTLTETYSTADNPLDFPLGCKSGKSYTYSDVIIYQFRLVNADLEVTPPGSLSFRCIGVPGSDQLTRGITLTKPESYPRGLFRACHQRDLFCQENTQQAPHSPARLQSSRVP